LHNTKYICDELKINAAQSKRIQNGRKQEK